MRSFFRIFFASLLALIVFGLGTLFLFLSFLNSFTREEIPYIPPKSVLVLDLSQHFREQARANPLDGLPGSNDGDVPGLFDVVRLVSKAATDNNIAGIYMKANDNPNGFASCDELRQALVDFRTSGKFVIAYADGMTQKSYHIANAAGKLYLHPYGTLEWDGLSVQTMFLKGLLDKLEIHPQVFYAGKFKSATEPFRTDHMTPENRLQTTVWLGGLYAHFLSTAADARKLDTAVLHEWANNSVIRTAADALDHRLVDGLKYEDEVQDEIRSELKLTEPAAVNYVSINEYAKTGWNTGGSGGRIAIIYAEGSIVDGKGSDDQIGAEEYVRLIRNVRKDRHISALVFRVNSGGGSAMASEKIWREIALCRKEKPVVVSFGDVAASGGYYISCAADSIFSGTSTITGSIGVFSLVPDMQAFFNHKLGITFDGVKTAPSADAPGIVRPLTSAEQDRMQASVNLIYMRFKERVAEGRHLDTAYVDSIGQGRVWIGEMGSKIGLTDRIGGLNDALACAARMAKLESYRVRSFPEPESWLERLFGLAKPSRFASEWKQEMKDEDFRVIEQVLQLQQLANGAQTRLPFDFFIH